MDDFGQELRRRLEADPPRSMNLAESALAKHAGDLDLPGYRELKLGQFVDLYSAVLFLDIRGFTRLSMALDPTETARILNAVIGVSADRLRSFGAHINDFPGDGIMAVFTEEDYHGSPEIHARALFGAAHLMEEMTATLQEALLQVGIEDPVRVAIGMYSGTVRWQRIGSPDCNRLMGVGEVAPLAAKFATSQHTEAWQTMIGGDIAHDVPDELKERQADFVRTYATETLTRRCWLLKTAEVATELRELDDARQVVHGTEGHRSLTTDSASLLGTVAPSIVRRGSGGRRDRGVG